MSKASDILRDRADWRTQCAATAPHHAGLTLREEAAFLSAVAALMDACVTALPGFFRCKICGAQGGSQVYSHVRTHMADCALAALERAITGER